MKPRLHVVAAQAAARNNKPGTRKHPQEADPLANRDEEDNVYLSRSGTERGARAPTGPSYAKLSPMLKGAGTVDVDAAAGPLERAARVRAPR
jgi:hypothetical protein